MDDDIFERLIFRFGTNQNKYRRRRKEEFGKEFAEVNAVKTVNAKSFFYFEVCEMCLIIFIVLSV